MVDCSECSMRLKCAKKGKKCSGINEVPYSKDVRNGWLGLLDAIDEQAKRELKYIEKGKKYQLDRKDGNMSDTVIPYLNREYEECKIYDMYRELCKRMDIGEIFNFV